MKKFIKKHKNKLLILMLTLISTLTLFLNIGKTYAYETNQFSYTIDNVQTESNSITYDSTTHTAFKNININATNMSLIFTLNETLTLNDCYILINFIPLVSDDNINYSLVTSPYARTIQILPRDLNNGNITSTTSVTYLFNDKTTITKNDITYYTVCTKLNFQDTSINTNPQYNIIKSFYCQFNTLSTTAKYNKIQILNIDFVDEAHLSLSQYYDNYYGGIADNYEQLQANYEALQNQYEDLDEEYTNLNTAYNELEDNYNTLEDDYISLEDNYNTLEGNYNTLEDDYNTLQDNYDSLNNALNNLPQYNGMESFINAFNGATIWLSGYGGTGPIQNSPTYTLQNFNESNFNLSRDTDTFYTWIQNNINTYGGFDIYIELAQPYTTSLSVGFNNVNYNHTISIYATPNGLSIATYGDYDVANNLIIVNPDNYYSFKMLSFSITQNDYDINISSNINGDQYMNGYNNGYNQSLLEWNDDLINARERIQTQNQLITSLQEQISATSQDYNLNNLMWTIASTPFESFKQIWNVNFLGVNITQMVTGLLTALIVLYIIKKFFL